MTFTIIRHKKTYTLKCVRYGSYWLTRCPFHTETTPSFRIKAKTGEYKCYSCGAGGKAQA